MSAEVKDATGATVLSIEVARRSAAERTRDRCSHLSITVDPLLTHVTCRRCGAEVNAVEWIATVAEHIACIETLYEKLRNFSTHGDRAHD